MTETEKQDLWKRLMDEKADLHDQQAAACADADQHASCQISARQAQVEFALNSLKEALSIRDLLAKIEAVGEKV